MTWPLTGPVEPQGGEGLWRRVLSLWGYTSWSAQGPQETMSRWAEVQASHCNKVSFAFGIHSVRGKMAADKLEGEWREGEPTAPTPMSGQDRLKPAPW